MIKSKKKGFTLVELLVTIILLGVIGAIIIYNMTSVSQNSKENEYERFVAKVKSAASVYADTYPDVFNELYVSKAYIYINIEDLVSNGLLDEDLTNPFTNQKIGLDEIIKANLDSTNGALTFEYPLKEKQKETSLVAMSDYVVWGEPYNCMRGLGSYELSLADENGNLIDLKGQDENGVDNLVKYNFECKMPDEFKKVEDFEGLGTRKAGNYDITYTWITESGTKKQATRTLRVLAEAVPTFKMNVSDYDFIEKENYVNTPCQKCGDDNFYLPSLNDDGSWNYLTYEPLIEGTDDATTVYRISKKRNDPESKDWEVITKTPENPEGYINYQENKKPYQADDGDKTYKLEAIITGHYEENYKYRTEGSGRFKEELFIPEKYITSEGNENWTTSKTYKINSDAKEGEPSHQSPVGIDYYEFRLSTSDSLDKKLAIDDKNKFEKNKSAVITEKNIVILNDTTTCLDEVIEYSNIYFRAVNKEGYVGKWTKYGTHITNQLTSLLESNSNGCTNGGSCCLKDNNGCHFTDKVVYVKFADQLFVALQQYKSDKSLLLALDGTTGVKVSPLTLKQGYAEQQTCDMLVWKNYNYYVANDAILKEAKAWANRTIKSSNHLVTPAVPNKGTNTVYTLNKSLLSTYSRAVKADSGFDYWLLDNGKSAFTVYLDQPRKHANESTTAYNAYFFYVSGTTASKQYGGQTAYVKPLIRIKNTNICGGTGSKDAPYIISK